MQFERLAVQNWRCFEDESIQFDSGVTILHGNNGAGKSSLLEAAFFALYGTDAFATGTTMDDVVTTDEDTAKVTLSFAHRGDSYEVSREIRIRASTSQHADLTTPPGQPDLDKTGDIDDLIEDELRLNADDFLNSAYVRQGDVTRLIEASPRERQRIIDNLLQMSKLERYRDRMDNIETGVGRVLDTKKSQIRELNGQINKYDESQIRSRKDQLDAFKTELDARRQTIDDEIGKLKEDKEDAKETVREQTQLKEDLAEQREEVTTQMNEFQSEVAEYTELQANLSEAKDDVMDAREELESLLSVGSGELTNDGSDAETVVNEVTAEVKTLITEDYGLTENGDGSQHGNLSAVPETPGSVAPALLGEAETDEWETIQSVDDLLAALSATIPPLTSAVTDEPTGDETVTIGTTDALSETDIDPVINPTVTVDTAAIRVPTPGLDAKPDTLAVDTAETAHEQTEETAAAIRDRLQALEEAVEDHNTKGEQLAREANEKKEAAEKALEDATSVLGEIEDIRYARAQLETERQDLRDSLRDSPIGIDAEQNELHTALETHLDTLEARIERLEAIQDHHTEQANELKGKISRADELLDEGNCPRCGRPVEEAPEVEHLSTWKDDRQTHEERAASLAEGIEQLTTRQETVEAFASDAVTLFGDEQAEALTFDGPGSPEGAVDPTRDIRPLHEEAAEHHLEARKNHSAATQKRIDSLVHHATAIVLQRAAERTLAQLHIALAKEHLLAHIVDATDNRRDAERERDPAETELETQATSVRDAHAEFQDCVHDHSELARQFNPVVLSEAEDTVEEKNEAIDTLEDELEEIRATKEAVIDHLGDFGRQLKQLEQLREERDTRRREGKAVTVLQYHVNELESMFVELREDLRQQNVHRLEDLLQEMFGTLYRNNAYADINLNSDYDATIIEKGGGELPPTKLLGGESAVFNIALRGAIYRLLTEGFEDDVPMPPLILDEPTAHLDDGHVDRIDDVVEAMREAGVKQTIVVSHDEELIDSADQRIKVRQQQGTNRSETEVGTGITLEL